MDIQAFFKISYGLYILSSRHGEKLNGHISNTIFQVTAEPARFAVCTNKNNLTTEYIQESKVISFSVLQQDIGLDFIGHFGFHSGRELDKFKDVNYITGKSGAPIVTDKTIAYFDCKVIESYDVGTHIMFIGEVVDNKILDNDKQPLTYKYYRDVIKGKSPKNAPTYIDKERLEEETEKEKLEETTKKTEKENDEHVFVCTVCGYRYEPSKGDEAAGIAPGTPFEDLPDDWTCPICGVDTDMFEKEV